MEVQNRFSFLVQIGMTDFPRPIHISNILYFSECAIIDRYQYFSSYLVLKESDRSDISPLLFNVLMSVTR